MRVSHKLTPCRMNQVAVGDLFIFDANNESFVGMKVVDQQHDDLALLEMNSQTPPRFDAVQGTSVLSFAKEFEIRIPTAPDSWCINRRPDDTMSLAVAADGKAYICVRDPNFTVFVDVEAGAICARPPGGPLAYPKKWEIVVFDQGRNASTIAVFE